MRRWENLLAMLAILATIMALFRPHAYAGLPCDFNEDGQCDATDVFALRDQGDLVGGVVPNDPKFDLTGDGLANMGDLNQWFREAVDYHAGGDLIGGDANLDGAVNRVDLNILALNWQANNRVWSEGDFTGDGAVNSADLMTIGVNWQQVGSPRDASVPEPASWLLICLAVFGIWIVVVKKRGHAPA